jgi:glycogen debranching enzyme
MFQYKISAIKDAYQIAVSDLRSNYGKDGIYAGPKNFKEYWARDAFFASYGALTLGDFEIVKKNLDLFTQYQRSDGHIPLRIEERFHASALIGLNVRHSTPQALHKPSQFWAGEAIDSNPLYLIILSEYVLTSGDKEWVIKNKDSVMKAVRWVEQQFNDKDLVTEGYNAGWADFTFKRGNVMYTNILVWRAFSLLCKALPPEAATYCSLLTKKLEKSISKNFWSKKRGYYFDHIGKHGFKHKVFASDGNLLSIFFDFTSGKRGHRIMRFIDKHNLNRIPVPIYFEGLEWRHKFFNELFYRSYNTQNTFTWWGSICAICRMKLGFTREAINDLFKLAKIINKYQTTPEIVNAKGKLVSNIWYKSELKSSWAAGMYVYACKYAEKEDLIELTK